MDDQEIFGFIECFRERLRRLIIVEPLMDLLHFVEDDDKELIRVKLHTQGNLSAVDQLLDTITRGVYPQGWFKEFIDALETVGCMHAGCYIMNSPPSPSLETENDSCVKLVQLLQPSLERMKTRDVCVSCHTLDILTEEDRDNIFAEIENHGNARGARLLLRRVVRNRIGWFSTFLRVLQKTGHQDLVRELLGEDMVDDEGGKVYDQGNVPDATKSPELKVRDVKSECSESATGLALEDSTESVTGQLYDLDGDTEIDLYTDPYEQVQQDIGNANMDSQSSEAPVGTPVNAPCSALEHTIQAAPPVSSCVGPSGGQIWGNPLSASRGRRPSSIRHYHHHHHHHAISTSEALLRTVFSGQRGDGAYDDEGETDSEAEADSSSDTDTDGDRGADVDVDANKWHIDGQGDDRGSFRGSDQGYDYDNYDYSDNDNCDYSDNDNCDYSDYDDE